MQEAILYEHLKVLKNEDKVFRLRYHIHRSAQGPYQVPGASEASRSRSWPRFQPLVFHFLAIA